MVIYTHGPTQGPASPYLPFRMMKRMYILGTRTLGFSLKKGSPCKPYNSLGPFGNHIPPLVFDSPMGPPTDPIVGWSQQLFPTE